MGWFEGGEDAPNRGGGGNDMPGGPTLLMLMLVGGFLFIMALCITSFGLMGIFYGLAASTIILCILGMIYGGW